MATPTHDKYFLKSLHEEIDLFDRKLAHLQKYDTSATEAERKASAGKLATKRESLARTARQLVSEGIEFKHSDLPRSFRTDELGAEGPAAMPAGVTQPPAIADAELAIPETVSPRPATGAKRSASPFAGTVLDGRVNLEAYKRTRSKAAAPQA